MSKAGVYFVRPCEPHLQIVTSELGPLVLRNVDLETRYVIVCVVARVAEGVGEER
jgi:hypothetical protein